MKYIRTPNGRILEWEKLNEVTRCVIDTCEEEVKEANTIEELCDEFVVEYEDTHNFVEYECAKSIDIEVASVYGAIWTDKGLIYVAKMNQEGKLELI
jgi:hypothetical protein